MYYTDFNPITPLNPHIETKTYDFPDSVCGCVCEIIAGTCVLILLPFICIGHTIELCFCSKENRSPIIIPPIPCF